MSTQLIEGLGAHKGEAVNLNQLNLAAFVSDEGKMLQVTIGNKYAQLTHNDTLTLTIELLKWLGEYSKSQIEECKKTESDIAKTLKDIHRNWAELNSQNYLLYELWKRKEK